MCDRPERDLKIPKILYFDGPFKIVLLCPWWLESESEIFHFFLHIWSNIERKNEILNICIIMYSHPHPPPSSPFKYPRMPLIKPTRKFYQKGMIVFGAKGYLFCNQLEICNCNFCCTSTVFITTILLYVGYF